MHLYSLTQIVMASHHQVVVLQRQGFTFAVKSEEMSTSKETLMQNKGKVNDDEVNSKQFWYLRSHPCGGKQSGSCIVPGLWYLFVFGKYYRISLVVHWQSRSTSWVRLLMLAPQSCPLVVYRPLRLISWALNLVSKWLSALKHTWGLWSLCWAWLI